MADRDKIARKRQTVCHNNRKATVAGIMARAVDIAVVDGRTRIERKWRESFDFLSFFIEIRFLFYFFVESVYNEIKEEGEIEMKGFKEGKNNLLCFGLAALLGMGGLGFGLTKNGEVSRLESELAQANQEVVHLTDSNQTLENEKDALISELEQTRSTAQELAVNAMAKASKQDVPAFSGSASFVVSEEKPTLNAESLFDELYVKAKEGKVETTAVVLGADNVRQDWQVEEDFEPLGWKSVTSDFIESDQFYQKTRLVPVELMDQAQDGLIVAGTPAFASELENYFSKIEDYIAETGNHVTYRVDPLYEPEAKLCNGVFLKARSMEDDMLSFDVFVYNEQPEFVIDRKTSDIRDLKKEAEEKKAARGRGA